MIIINNNFDDTFYDVYYEENESGIKGERYRICECGSKLMKKDEEGRVICNECKKIQNCYKYD